MSAIQQPTPNHQGETFGSGETQFFECEALSADHPEIQARERPANSACNSPIQQRRKPGPHRKGKRRRRAEKVRKRGQREICVPVKRSSRCPLV